MIIPLIDVANKQSYNFRLHRENGSDDYLFVLFKSPARVLVNGVYEKADSGMCIFFDKNKIQSYFPVDNKEFLHDFIHFDLETDFEKLLFSDIPTGKLIHLALPDIVSNTLYEIKSEVNNGFSEYKNDILTNLGTVFLYRIKNEIERADINDKKRPHFNTLHSLRLDIYRNPQKNYSIDEICKKVCMSRSYFQHLYKDFFSVSCIHDITNAKIAHAKLLLFSSDLRINEIAVKCGYLSTEHFIRQFKKFTGTTPEKFRKA